MAEAPAQPEAAQPPASPLPPTGALAGAQAVNSVIPGVTGIDGGIVLCGYGSPLLSGAGGGLANPCGIPGYGVGGTGYGPGVGTWSLMLRHPTIRHARADTFAPIIDSQWTVEAGKQEEAQADPELQEAAAHVQETLERLRPQLVTDALRALDFGWAPFEPVWDHDEDGFFTISRMRPLAVSSLPLAGLGGGYTEPIDDERGELKALRNVPVKGPAVTLEVSQKKAWVYTYDREFGSILGRSILENIREHCWLDYLDARQQLQAIGFKVSGRQAYAIVPPGGYTDPRTNTFRTFAQDAADALTAFAQGKQPVLIRPYAQSGDPRAAAGAMGDPLVVFETVDFGDAGASMTALLARMDKAERQMYDGYLRSARTGSESQFGSRADAETHTNSAVTVSQSIANDLAGQVQVLADWLGEINYGLRPGTLRVRQSPLVDSRKSVYQQLLSSLLFNQGFQMEAARTVNVDKMLDAMDIPRVANFREVLFDQQQQQGQQQGQQPAPGETAGGEGQAEGEAGTPEAHETPEDPQAAAA